MKTFVCVYRHFQPNERDMQKVTEAPISHPALTTFLKEYNEQNCFYDWGDDPAFFAARKFGGNVNLASWGVCRRDVRSQLVAGDIVVYFCAKQPTPDEWVYYYIGFGTVKEVLNREAIWNNKEYALYREYFNTLIKYTDDKREHYEPFGIPHKDWEKRATAGFALFEEETQQTNFNIINPLCVARYRNIAQSNTESWFFDNNPVVRQLEQVLFSDLSISRRLRTTHPQRPHRHIPLHTYAKPENMEKYLNLRSELLRISELVKIEN